jgi:acetyl esterase/lipase
MDDCMPATIDFRGPKLYRLRSAACLSDSVVEVSARRLLKGPRRPGWSWLVEVGTEMLKRQATAAFRMSDVNEARSYLDSMVIHLPALEAVSITPVEQATFKGSWFAGRGTQTDLSVLYLHGGGYSYYPKAYANFIALITRAAKGKVFALDYRLAPEHRFPAQLDDALSAYRWLLEDGVHPDQLVLAGDSAGANLALALLLSARDSRLPMPALAIALSPPTDFEASGGSLDGNAEWDWITPPMLTKWADWFCDPAQRHDPRVSPLRADLTSMPPIYIQAGGCEVLYDSIQAFADHARDQDADVVLEVWEDMPHVFQMFGPYARQSAEALRRISAVIDARVRAPQEGGTRLQAAR